MPNVLTKREKKTEDGIGQIEIFDYKDFKVACESFR